MYILHKSPRLWFGMDRLPGKPPKILLGAPSSMTRPTPSGIGSDLVQQKVRLRNVGVFNKGCVGQAHLVVGICNGQTKRKKER